jgi:hypothetical protein
MTVMLRWSNKSAMDQLFNGGDNPLQGLTEEIDPCFQVRQVRCGHLVIRGNSQVTPSLNSIYVASAWTLCRTQQATPVRR